MSKLGGKYIFIKFTEDLIGEISPTEHDAFSIIGNENYYNGGSLIPRDYEVESVVMMDNVNDTLILTFSINNKFNSNVGELTVNYNATKGSLEGRGGRVESFNIPFTPKDLIGNAKISEKLIIDSKLDMNFKRIYYTDTEKIGQGKIKVSIGNISVSLIPVEIVNP